VLAFLWVHDSNDDVKERIIKRVRGRGKNVTHEEAENVIEFLGKERIFENSFHIKLTEPSRLELN
jgi:hypothetical protein